MRNTLYFVAGFFLLTGAAFVCALVLRFLAVFLAAFLDAVSLEALANPAFWLTQCVVAILVIAIVVRRRKGLLIAGAIFIGFLASLAIGPM